MKHAGPDALAALATLLDRLRDRAALREKTPGVFSLRSRAFLHFHEDARGLFADVRLGADFTRLPVTTARQQALLLRRVDAHLSAQRPPAARREA